MLSVGDSLTTLQASRWKIGAILELVIVSCFTRVVLETQTIKSDPDAIETLLSLVGPALAIRYLIIQVIALLGFAYSMHDCE